MKTTFKFAAAGFVAAAFASIPVFAQNATGAGASFPAPLYAKWASDFNKATGTQDQLPVRRLGRRHQADRRQDRRLRRFGHAPDRRRTQGQGPDAVPDRHRRRDSRGQHPGIKPGDLKLSGPVLATSTSARSPSGTTRRSRLSTASLALPDAAIATVRRADGSGTTFLFTNYLSKANPEWKSKVGDGTAVNWPNGAGGKGNEGVAAFVNRLPNSIGYVEYAYVKQNKMTYAQMQNKDGSFVSPDDSAFKAAAAGADWSKTFYQVLTDQPGKESWPITGATFILMHKAQDKPAQAATTLRSSTGPTRTATRPPPTSTTCRCRTRSRA
jgi:phosphate transport system substrate-binding protein